MKTNVWRYKGQLRAVAHKHLYSTVYRWPKK